jgi:hypothetical protein
MNIDTKDKIKTSEAYWKVCLTEEKLRLADLVEDQADTLDIRDRAVLDYGPSIIKVSNKIDEINNVLTQLKTLKNGK